MTKHPSQYSSKGDRRGCVGSALAEAVLGALRRKAAQVHLVVAIGLGRTLADADKAADGHLRRRPGWCGRGEARVNREACYTHD